MSLRVGDTFFNRDGRPATVVGQEPKKENLIVEQEGPRYEKTRSYGYINGLSQEERKEFESIVDEARDTKNFTDRINRLQGRIENMQLDPKKQVLTRYLEGELAHLMNTEGTAPRVYQVERDRV